MVLSIAFTGKLLTFAFTTARSRARRSSKILPFRGLRGQPRYKKMAENEPIGRNGPHGTNFTHHLSFPPLPRFWISIFGMELGHLMPFTFWISIFGNELYLMSTWFVLFAYLVWNQFFFIGFFFYHFFVLGCCVFRSTNLIDKNGSRELPFSASSFDSQCRLLRPPLCLFNLQVLSLFHWVFFTII